MDVDMNNEVETPMAAGEQSEQPSRTIDPVMERLANLAQNLDICDDFDVEFRCQGWSIKAHKDVIREMAPKLADACQSDLGPEAPDDAKWIYGFQSVDHDTLWLFVRFLYKGRLVETPTFENAKALYQAAHCYQARGLARACAPILIEGLTVENAWEVLLMAIKREDSQFVDEIKPFIYANRVDATREQWADFMSTDHIRRWWEASLADGEDERLLEEIRNRGSIFPPSSADKK